MKVAVRILPLVTGEGTREIRALIGIELRREGVMCGRGFRHNEQTESDHENTVEHASHECLLRKSCCWPDCFVLLTRILLCLFQISHTSTPPPFLCKCSFQVG